MSRTDVKERKIRGKDIEYKSLNKGCKNLILSNLFINQNFAFCRRTVKKCEDSLRFFQIQHFGQLRNRRFRNFVNRTEFFYQFLKRNIADAGDILKNRVNHRLRSFVSVKSDSKTVRFIA